MAPIVWLGAKYVEKELFQMKALDPWSVAATILVLALAALLSVLLPATRAASIQPIDALRQE